MKIAVFGSGGVGGYFGGLLVQGGHNVYFIARGAHLDALQRDGLKVLSVNGDFHLHPVQATDDPGTVPSVDYVVVAVKHYHLAPAAPQIKELVGANTTVVPLLNGVDAHEVLIEAVGREPVVGGLCSIVSMIESPGVIRQASSLRRVVVGELDRSRSERVARIVQAWASQGVDAVQADDIHVAMWTKLLFIASFGGVGSLTRANAGEILGTPETRAVFVQAMTEVEALARAQGIDLAPDVVSSSLAFAESFEPTATSSMQRDVISGNRFELEAFSGKITRLGEELRTPTPVHRTFYGLLMPYLQRARG